MLLDRRWMRQSPNEKRPALSCTRHQLSRQRLPGLAEPARQATPCRTSSKGPRRDSPRRSRRCAGRTDAGVHALNQVHFDTDSRARTPGCAAPTASCLPRRRRCNGGLVDEPSIARQRAADAIAMSAGVAGPAGLEAGLVGWVFRPLDGVQWKAAAAVADRRARLPRSGPRVPGAVASQDAAAHPLIEPRRRLALRWFE